MKKILTKLVCCMLVLCMMLSALAGCSSSNWKGDVSLLPSGAGALTENGGGFIAETEKYLYFINGQGTSTDDNTMGKPIKAALCVAEKDNMANVQIVVPKLFVASESDAGLFIDGEYVYYGSPSIEKNSSGEIANSELTFLRTKLDGSGQTDEYFTAKSLSLEYRIVKGANNNVCIYYYDTEETAIMCYDTADKSLTCLIKTDDKADEYSMDNYTFLDADGSHGIVALATAKIYKDAYDENIDTRIEEQYNKIFAIKAGEKAVSEIVSGEYLYQENGETKKDISKNEKYQIKLVNDKYMFYTRTMATTIVYNEAIKIEDLATKAWKDIEKKTIVNDAYVADTNLIEDLEEVYVLGESKLYKTTLLAKDNLTKTPISKKDGINSLLYKKGDNIFYYNSKNQLAMLNVNAGEEIKISDDTVVTTWFDPEIKTVKVGEENKECIFYCDNSSNGKSYIKYMQLDLPTEKKEVEETVTTGEGENAQQTTVMKEITFLKGESKLLGIMTAADQANIINARMEALSTRLPEGGLTATDADKEFVDEVNAVKALYDGITDENIKKEIKEDNVKGLDNYKEAIRIAELYNKLSGIQNCHSEDEAKAAYKDIYDQVKADLDAHKQSELRETIDGYINTNLKSYFTMAEKWFNPPKTAE